MNWLEPEWPLPANVRAAATLRHGGVGAGAYASFNLAAHVNDNPEHVRENRALLKNRLDLPAEPVWLRQVHGIAAVDAAVAMEPEADASYAAQAGVVCVVLTADCLPVLFCGDGGRVVAAAHAGWRGLAAGVLRETAAAMRCARISAWLGPAIGPERFMVGADVYLAFTQANPQAAAAFRAVSATHWLADIYHLARLDLAAAGVGEVYGGGFCTVSEAERFFSYRRDAGVTGRMASLIWRS